MLRLFPLFLLVLMVSGQVQAACTNPAAPTGKIIYNTTHDTFQGCLNSGQWMALSGGQGPQGPQGPAGPAGSDATADDLGDHTATQNLNMATNKITNLGTPTATTDAATKAYVDANAGTGIGVGQTWQNVTASRAFSTNYQNTTGKPIMVAVTVTANTTGGGGTTGGLSVSTDASTWIHSGQLTSVTNGTRYHLYAIVPNNHYYRFVSTFVDMTHWGELR